MCIKPIEIYQPIKNKNRRKSKRLKRSEKLTVPCGWCVDCLNTKSSSWAVRLQEE